MKLSQTAPDVVIVLIAKKKMLLEVEDSWEPQKHFSKQNKKLAAAEPSCFAISVSIT